MSVRELIEKLSECDQDAEVLLTAPLRLATFDALVRSCGFSAVAAVIPTALEPDGRRVPRLEMVPAQNVEFVSAFPPGIPKPWVAILE